MRATAQIVLFALLGSAGILPIVFPAVAGAQREPAVPKELLERIGDWAENFLKQAPGFTAVETREESRWSRKGAADRRSVVSRYSVRAAADGESAEESRETLSVDGRKVTAPSKPEAAKGAEAMPSPLALVARLATRNHSRMRYFFAPDTSEALADYVLIGYRQMDGEGLADVDGKAVYPAGQAWVDADDGHIVRLEEQSGSPNERQTLALEFVRDETLKAWVPREITVRVFSKGHMQRQIVYTYSDFERLTPADRAASNSPR